VPEIVSPGLIPCRIRDSQYRPSFFAMCRVCAGAHPRYYPPHKQAQIRLAGPGRFTDVRPVVFGMTGPETDVVFCETDMSDGENGVIRGLSGPGFLVLFYG